MAAPPCANAPKRRMWTSTKRVTCNSLNLLGFQPTTKEKPNISPRHPSAASSGLDRYGKSPLDLSSAKLAPLYLKQSAHKISSHFIINQTCFNCSHDSKPQYGGHNILTCRRSSSGTIVSPLDSRIVICCQNKFIEQLCCVRKRSCEGPHAKGETGESAVLRLHPLLPRTFAQQPKQSTRVSSQLQNANRNSLQRQPSGSPHAP